MGGLKDNVSKSDQEVVEGRVLHVQYKLEEKQKAIKGHIRRKQRGQGQKIIMS